MVKMTIIQSLFGLVVMEDSELVVVEYEEIYMEQPKGFMSTTRNI